MRNHTSALVWVLLETTYDAKLVWQSIFCLDRTRIAGREGHNPVVNVSVTDTNQRVDL
jgi:hypothetical protein